MSMKYAIVFVVVLVLMAGCSKSQDFEKVISALEPRKFKDKKYSYALPFRLHIPDGYNKKNRYPLILFLHGGGGRGDDNRRHIDEAVAVLTSDKVQQTRKFFVVAPQCPEHSQWVNTKFETTPFDNYRQDNIPESEAMKMVMEILNNLENEFNIDSGRIYTIGLSMGASGVWDMITRYPKRFAAAVTISGVSDPSKADKITHLPIWSFHGKLDNISPLKVTINMVDALNREEGDCRLTIYDKKGHDIGHLVYNNSEVLNWMLSKRNKYSID